MSDAPLTPPARLTFAMESLAQDGILAGARTHRLSARIDPGLLAAARARTGIQGDSELVTAALAVLAAPDDFGAWLVRQSGHLPPKFDAGL
jgi:hypothetical protein